MRVTGLGTSPQTHRTHAGEAQAAIARLDRYLHRRQQQAVSDSQANHAQAPLVAGLVVNVRFVASSRRVKTPLRRAGANPSSGITARHLPKPRSLMPCRYSRRRRFDAAGFTRLTGYGLRVMLILQSTNKQLYPWLEHTQREFRHHTFFSFL